MRRLHAMAMRPVCRLVLILTVLGMAFPAQAQYFRFGKNKVQYEAPDWFYVQSKHFDVYYYPGGYPLADFTARAAESAYAQLADLFQHQISDRIPLIVYQSHNDFVVTNAVDLPAYSEGIGGVTELFKNRIAIPFTGDYRDFRRVIHHELVHAVLNDLFYGGSIQSIIHNNIQLDIPLWFSEGLAEYAALGWDTQSDMYVREAVLEDDLAPIRHLDGYFAYRGGQAVWDYVAEQYGREKIGEILQRVRLTRSVETAFRRATGLTLDELSERWHRTLKEVYYPELAARENIDETARALITREDGYYNTSPALSPQGDRLAYVTARGALFDVYLADAADGRILRKLVDGQDNPQFESLRILTPGLSWSPDGTRIAVAVKSGPSDAIALLDVETRRATHYRVPGIDQILTVAWSPDGNRIAFEGSRDAQSDIYVLDLRTRETINCTNDLFSDHEPAWSPDGRFLAFHSDRGGFTELGRYTVASYAMDRHDYGQHDVYLVEPGAATATRLTFDETWDDEHPRFGATPDRLLFVSDRNGIHNLYEKNLATGAERPLTDLVVGITGLSVSADGSRAALVALHEGTPSIFLMKNPFDRKLEREVLVPNVWAQRVTPGLPQPAPALALAPPSLRRANPILRDASDGRAFARRRVAPPDLLASRTLLPSIPPDTLAADTTTAGIARADTALADSAAYGGVRIDFRNYIFSDGFDRAAALDPDLEDLDRFDPVDNLDENGSYRPRRYKLSFSPDLVYGAAGVDMYGVQGVTQMMFSDMLGNHQIFVATNLLVDLRNSDYVLSYSYLPRRIDWSVSGFHVSRLLPDYTRFTYYRYRQYGGGVAVSYPFDKFRRVDLDLQMIGVSSADIGDPTAPTQTRSMFYPALTFTRDVTTPGYLFPVGGTRFAASLSGSPGAAVGRSSRFFTVLADARGYASALRGMYSLALRASGGTSVGPNPQLFYSAGVQNWINRHFDRDNGYPISDVTDFAFATPVMPLRGPDLNAHNGSNFWLANAEFRFPLVAALLPGPMPLIPLYNIQGAAFLDVGSIWGGRNLDRRFNVFRRDAEGRRVFDDLIVGAGFGLRTILLGYPFRIDYAWPHDGQRFGRRRVYLSIGLDF